MNIFQNFDWSLKSIAKILGSAFLGIVVLVFVVSLISFALRTIFNTGDNYSESYPQAMNAEKSAFVSRSDFAVGQGGGIVPPIENDQIVDQNAENFEIEDYNLDYETRKKDELCSEILKLKKRPEIIFESSTEEKSSCSYSFKVKKENATEILELLKTFDPKNIRTNIYTIQKTIEGLSDQLTIFKKKLSAIEETLADAQKSYDELTKLATKKQDVESLTKLIDLKLNTIDRLFKERSGINEQIDNITKNRTEQLDRLKYTNFTIYVREYLFVDWESIKDEWKFQIKELVTNFNDVIQGISIKLLSYILRVFEGIIYLFISLLIMKFVWFFGKRVWKGKGE